MTLFRHLAIPELIEVVPPRYGDDRGFFSEVWKRSDFEAEGIHIDWIQDNHSRSAAAGTVRGLHFQAPPFAQAKLIRVLRGAILDVAVDIRTGSPSYGEWVALTLSAEAGNQMFVPAGFAHGFMTLTPDCEVAYKVDMAYAPEHEAAIMWNDPAIGIDWPDLGTTPALSWKDAAAPGIAGFASPFRYGEA